MNTLGNIAEKAQMDYTLQQQTIAKKKANIAFNQDEAKKAAEDFEAFFITTTLESMFSGIKPNSLTGGGTAEKIYRSMMFNEYGKLMAKNGGIGVSEQVMTSILAMQEANN